MRALLFLGWWPDFLEKSRRDFLRDILRRFMFFSFGRSCPAGQVDRFGFGLVSVVTVITRRNCNDYSESGAVSGDSEGLSSIGREEGSTALWAN